MGLVFRNWCAQPGEYYMIYCVEDDASIREIELYTLRSTGFNAEGFADSKAFFEAIDKELPKLIILDDAPQHGRRGNSDSAQSRSENEEIPVIMATAGFGIRQDSKPRPGAMIIL